MKKLTGLATPVDDKVFIVLFEVKDEGFCLLIFRVLGPGSAQPEVKSDQQSSYAVGTLVETDDRERQISLNSHRTAANEMVKIGLYRCG